MTNPTPPGYRELYSHEFQVKLQEIQSLLAEAYEKALARDGHCKSSEGHIEISLPAYFWSHGDRRPEISIYSYGLGPSRMHDFPHIDKALTEVRKWHKSEMEFVECPDDCKEECCEW